MHTECAGALGLRNDADQAFCLDTLDGFGAALLLLLFLLSAAGSEDLVLVSDVAIAWVGSLFLKSGVNVVVQPVHVLGEALAGG